MGLTYGFFNSVNSDRKYTAEQMSAYFKGLISRGVLQNFGDGFQITSAGGVQLNIGTGRAFFSDGRWLENDAVITVALDAADLTNPRIDRVILRKDMTNAVRACSVVVRTGTPAASPQPPALTNDDSAEEMSLAQIYIAPNVVTITTANITDERPNESVCGFVTGLIEQIGTEELFRQYRAAWDEWFTTVKADMVSATLIQQFNTSYTTVSQNETIIPINVALYKREIDILNVYVNGLKFIEGEDYIVLDNTHISLTHGLDIGQTIQVEVFKSIDATGADDVGAAINSLTNGLSDVTGRFNAFADDTGWITLPLTNGAAPYLAEFPPQYRRIGKQVYLRGRVSKITTETFYFATLPVGFRPSDYSPRYLASCNSTIFARVYINGGTGNLVCEMMSDGNYPAERWMDINYTFLID